MSAPKIEVVDDEDGVNSAITFFGPDPKPLVNIAENRNNEYWRKWIELRLSETDVHGIILVLLSFEDKLGTVFSKSTLKKSGVMKAIATFNGYIKPSCILNGEFVTRVASELPAEHMYSINNDLRGFLRVDGASATLFEFLKHKGDVPLDGTFERDFTDYAQNAFALGDVMEDIFEEEDSPGLFVINSDPTESKNKYWIRLNRNFDVRCAINLNLW